ncbi:MAG: lipid A biosynthesis lauroyl acyltransferase [Micavibrio sp.]|nr:MAG: lipid A biosynthesis lauroyl acyltransferase [Micavibrio sp.]
MPKYMNINSWYEANIEKGGMNIKKIIRPVKHRAEAVLILGLLAVLGMLPVDMASAIGGKVVRIVGPYMRQHKRALDNLARFMPALSEKERKALALTMWENAGRVFGEIPHGKRILDDPERFRFIGIEEAIEGVPDDLGGVTVSGHCGNWEISPAPSYKLKKPQLSFYRSINNRILDRALKKYREEICTGEMVAKGADSMKRAMQAVQKGQFIGMLVDQRESQGIVAPFMGVDAKTNHAPALLVCRYKVPLYIGFVIREKGAHFRMECQRVDFDLTGDNKIDVLAITTKINDIFSAWILKHPDQWLWTTRRW